jgi:hypothetical protein
MAFSCTIDSGVPSVNVLLSSEWEFRQGFQLWLLHRPLAQTQRDRCPPAAEVGPTDVSKHGARREEALGIRIERRNETALSSRQSTGKSPNAARGAPAKTSSASA